MDLADKVAELAVRVERQRDQMVTEQASKQALVLPLLQALGYDVFNPLEVRPEFVSDVGTKKGEKVDYALDFDGGVKIIIECKPLGSKLEVNHASQLFRYFAVTNAKFSILTDGCRYCFYTDLDAQNKMDAYPFFVFDISSYREGEIEHLKRFSRNAFDVDAITKTASEMKYLRALRGEIERELTSPSEDFVRLVGKRVYNANFTSNVAEKFRELIKRAATAHIRDKVDSRLRNALHTTQLESEPDVEAIDEDDDGISTTELEIDGFKTIQAIAAEFVDPSNVHMRDQKSYCSILYENNNRKPIVRLWFNNERRLLVQFFDGPESEKVQVNRTVDLYRFKSRIKETLAEYTELRQDEVPDNERSPAADTLRSDPIQTPPSPPPA